MSLEDTTARIQFLREGVNNKTNHQKFYKISPPLVIEPYGEVEEICVSLYKGVGFREPEVAIFDKDTRNYLIYRFVGETNIEDALKNFEQIFSPVTTG